jgi:NAD(P)-dependent dehydrogenase (short-subunit alcohol dehydrogenase family)
MALREFGRVAVVVGVGARKGLGAALARRFAREGFHTFVSGRTPERLKEAAGEIEAAGGRATPVVSDPTCPEDVTALLDQAVDQSGSLDVVAYNAGSNRFSPLLEMSDDCFDDLWPLCCFGGFLVGREAARRMLPQGSGSILFTGTTAPIRARSPFTAIASAKAALRSVAQGMARELGPHGIHVGHVITDGMMDDERLHSRFTQIEEQKGEMGMLDIDAIVDSVWTLHVQRPSAWAHELDL